MPGLNGAYPGATVSLFGSNLDLSQAPVVTIGGQPVGVLYASPTQLNLLLPVAVTPGPAILTLNNGAAAAFPITVNVDPLPAGINAIQNSSGAYIGATQPAHPGDLLTVTLSNLAPPGSTIALNRVQVNVGGISHPALQITQSGTVWQVSFLMNPSDPVGQSEQLILYLDGHSSYPASISVANTP